MKPRIVIVGAGLGGCFVAHGLADTHDVTFVELPPATNLQRRIIDVAAPAIIDPHVAAGLGGTSALWHNGLIEIDDAIFAEWPVPKSELMPFYRSAYPLLAGVSIDTVSREAASLRERYRVLGLSDARLPCLFYPRKRRNAWSALKLAARVGMIRGEVVALEPNGTDAIQAVLVRTENGEKRIAADIFVLAAGGLATPLLLQQLSTRLPLTALQNAGRHYEDHPMAFVAELKTDAPFYRLWNYSARGTNGNIRMPLVIKQDGLDVSFQVRPAAHFYGRTSRHAVKSIVTDIRNNRFNPMGYLRLITHGDDVLDILSFALGIRVPTNHYTLLMYAQQPASPDRDVWGVVDEETGVRTIQRNWRLPGAYLATLDRAVAQVIDRFGTLLTSASIFPNWHASIHSAAHHSGTARMAASPTDGVCDADARVFGLRNLYVADGSLIPSSGIANTGLTIAALALRLAKHLQARHTPPNVN